MHLPAAVIRAHIGIRDKRDDEMRIHKVRGDALLPLAADLYSLVIPDIIATPVHIRDYRQHNGIVGMGIAYENIRLIALIWLKVFKILHFYLQFRDMPIIILIAGKCNYHSVKAIDCPAEK